MDSGKRLILSNSKQLLLFLSRKPDAKFCRVLHHRAGVRMGGGPAAGVLAKAIHVAASLAGEVVFGAPEFFKDRIHCRFHRSILPSIQAVCKLWAILSLIVYDRFHLVMNVNQAVDEVRRTQCRKASKEDRQLIKGQRYLILGNQEDLDADARGKLDKLLEANEAISTAYILKEQFRWLFSYKRLGWAMRALDNWCAMALASGLAPFQRLARGFQRQSEKVCGFVKHGLTSGLIEGFNNLIARMIHKAYGYRDLDYLELKLRHRSVMH